MVTNVPKGILDRYKKVTPCCDLMHIKGIVFLVTIPPDTLCLPQEVCLKNIKVKNIEYGIKEVNNAYL